MVIGCGFRLLTRGYIQHLCDACLFVRVLHYYSIHERSISPLSPFSLSLSLSLSLFISLNETKMKEIPPPSFNHEY